mmetsp:Transcript_8254/g.15035  ORF Transcript_8254/g.15035 Transcript_8254/m.15035 type:complete len:249 (-) Transcript_8254:207-953(-)
MLVPRLRVGVHVPGQQDEVELPPFLLPDSLLVLVSHEHLEVAELYLLRVGHRVHEVCRKVGETCGLDVGHQQPATKELQASLLEHPHLEHFAKVLLLHEFLLYEVSLEDAQNELVPLGTVFFRVEFYGEQTVGCEASINRTVGHVRLQFLIIVRVILPECSDHVLVELLLLPEGDPKDPRRLLARPLLVQKHPGALEHSPVILVLEITLSNPDLAFELSLGRRVVFEVVRGHPQPSVLQLIRNVHELI